MLERLAITISQGSFIPGWIWYFQLGVRSPYQTFLISFFPKSLYSEVIGEMREKENFNCLSL